jgi:homocitrate synthase NifV
MSGLTIANGKAVTGRRIFTVESGIHVAAMEKDASLYEPFAPELVGAERRIVLGAHSGRASVRSHCARLGLPCGEERLPELLDAVRAESRAKKDCLTEGEFLALHTLIAGEKARAPAASGRHDA